MTDVAASADLREHLTKVFSLAPDAVAVETKDGPVTWRALAQAGDEVERLLVQAGVDRSAPVGWVARNRAASVASFAALVRYGRMVVPLRPNLTPAAFCSELGAQRLQAVIGDADDWSVLGAVESAAQAGSAGILVTGEVSLQVAAVPELTKVGLPPHREPMPGYVLERLTSGTTGAPKRIPVKEEVLLPSLRSGEQKSSGGEEPLRLQTSPALLFKPFSHAGGLFGLLLALYQARPVVLFEKFVAEDWAQAVRRFQPKSASLVPAMIQMIMDAEIPADWLRSLRAIRSGTAPLDPAMQIAFEERYGVPILVDYGAAEFIGGVAGWTLADHKAFAKTKRRSVGRPRSDVSLRVVSAESGEALPSDQVGILHIKCDRFGPDWFITNDLALIDSDGFLFLHGRADDAINRGGFKILPDEVAVVLRRYPGVRDAAVVGAPDPRLGQVPVAAIEMKPGEAHPTAEALNAFAREHLTAYMVPKVFHFVDELPRTASMKVSRPELKKLLGL
ncbi:MAG: long-chain fatty acid--CoA ligase [Pseudomonas sp.]|uniref:class I adenylate-forming enzyme family protein n=1 Tax=Pseudomonas sp. TaxID=306 RepID=UPI0039829F61